MSQMLIDRKQPFSPTPFLTRPMPAGLGCHALPQGPQDRGPGCARMANHQLFESWKGTAEGDSYHMLFGNQGYVQDLQDETLRGLLMELPDDACPGLKEKAQQGKLKESDIRDLQNYLVSKGYDVGPTGADGKYGPNTHRALEKMLNGQPPDMGRGGAPKQTSAVPGRMPARQADYSSTRESYLA